MKLYKTLFWITLISGLVIFSIGIYLNYLNQYSEAVVAGRFGPHPGMINGFSGMFLGVLILLLSVLNYKLYKKEKKKFDQME